MRIGLISPYPLEIFGGVQSHILNQYTELKKHHEVKIIAPGPPSGISSSNLDDIIHIGHSVALPPVYGTRSSVALGIDYSAEISDLFEKWHFDLLHFHSPGVPALPWQILELSPTINIVSFHTVLDNNIFSMNFLHIIGEYLNRKIHGRIAVSKQAEKFGQNFAPGVYKIIPNGIDIERFSPEIKPLEKFDSNLINILFVGRIEKRKGLNFLIRIFKKLKGEGFPLRLIVVGEGMSLESYKNFSETDDIYFEGAVSDELLPRYYASADIFCSPALYNESFGIVLLEAMASGKPIVAGNNDGYKELIENKNVGFLVNPKSTKEFRSALVSLIEDESLRKNIGENGHKFAQNYSWEKVGIQLEDYYKTVLAENTPEKEPVFKIF